MVWRCIARVLAAILDYIVRNPFMNFHDRLKKQAGSLDAFVQRTGDK